MIATEQVRALLTQLDDPGFTNPRLGREPFRVYAEKWFAARPVMASTKNIRSYLDAQLLLAFGDVPLSQIDRFLVQEWIERLVDPDDPDARTYAPESIHSFYAALSTIMKYAPRWTGTSPSASLATALSTFLARGSTPGSSSLSTSSRTS